jgi:lipopolysaccharide biosynthesis protein
MIIKSQFSSVGIWKGSTLATMQVLSEETRRELDVLSTNVRMTKRAEARDVRLKKAGEAVVRVSQKVYRVWQVK